MSEIGHNSGMNASELREFVNRIERLESEKGDLAEDIRGVYAEAKGRSFDTKVLRAVIRRRKMDKAAREEFDAMLDLYEHGIFG